MARTKHHSTPQLRCPHGGALLLAVTAIASCAGPAAPAPPTGRPSPASRPTTPPRARPGLPALIAELDAAAMAAAVGRPLPRTSLPTRAPAEAALVHFAGRTPLRAPKPVLQLVELLLRIAPRQDLRLTVVYLGGRARTVAARRDSFPGAPPAPPPAPDLAGYEADVAPLVGAVLARRASAWFDSSDARRCKSEGLPRTTCNQLLGRARKQRARFRSGGYPKPTGAPAVVGFGEVGTMAVDVGGGAHFVEIDIARASGTFAIERIKVK